MLPSLRLSQVSCNTDAVVSDPYDLETDWSGFEATKGDMDGDGGW